MEPNSLLLSCLLYLGSISSPNTYTTCTISQLEHARHQEIVSMQSNTPLMNYIIAEYEDDANLVEVYTEECQ